MQYYSLALLRSQKWNTPRVCTGLVGVEMKYVAKSLCPGHRRRDYQIARFGNWVVSLQNVVEGEDA